MNRSREIAQAFDILILDILKAKRPDKYGRASAALARKLTHNWSEYYLAALEDALGILKRSPIDKPSQADIDRILKGLSDDLGEPIAAAVQKDVKKVVNLTYAAGARDIVGTGYAFDLIDEKAIRALWKHNVYWIRSYYDRNLGEKVAKVGEQALSEGLTKSETARLFQSTFTEQFPKETSAYWRGFSNNAITRSRSLGQVGGYVEAGASVYRISAIIDKLTSEICLGMNGKEFTVERAVNLRDDLIASENTDNVKSVAPWRKPGDLEDRAGGTPLKDIPADQLPAGMEFPPYHFNCRTTTVMVR